MKQHVAQLALLSLLLLGFDCNPAPPTPVRPQPTPVVTDSDWCEKAQENLLRLQCAEGEPTKKGKSFAEFCRETQENGIFLNPRCLAGIDRCQMIASCTPTK